MSKSKLFLMGVGAVIGLIVFEFVAQKTLVVFYNAYSSPI